MWGDTEPTGDRPHRVRRDPLVAGVIRTVAELPEPDRSVLRLRYGLNTPPFSEEDAAAHLGLTLRELWHSEAAALETLGFLLLTEVSVLELLESLR